MTPILKAVDVSKSYKIGDNTIQAIKNVSLDIYPGDFTAIIGKSGSGKSTLMHLLGLLDTPTTGNIILKDKDVSKYTERQLARIRNNEIGFVFQFFNLLQRATCLDNVMLPLKYSNMPKSQWKQRSLDMLNLVGLSDRIYNKSNELSGGQKQRVAIARALVNDPAVIFADEPTGNLDSKTGDEITNMFIELNKQGKTIILVTHDDDLAKIAKKQVVIKDGTIIK